MMRLLQAVEIDLHGHRRARTARGRRLICIGLLRRGRRPRPPVHRRPAGALPTPASSSLSGRSGLGSPFFSTARYRPKFSLWS